MNLGLLNREPMLITTVPAASWPCQVTRVSSSRPAAAALVLSGDVLNAAGPGPGRPSSRLLWAATWRWPVSGTRIRKGRPRAIARATHELGEGQ